MSDERCPHCGALKSRAPKARAFVLRYEINGAKFRRTFDDEAGRDLYAATLRENNIRIITNIEKEPQA
jgi:hypothetical protein